MDFQKFIEEATQCLETAVLPRLSAKDLICFACTSRGLLSWLTSDSALPLFRAAASRYLPVAYRPGLVSATVGGVSSRLQQYATVCKHVQQGTCEAVLRLQADSEHVGAACELLGELWGCPDRFWYGTLFCSKTGHVQRPPGLSGYIEAVHISSESDVISFLQRRPHDCTLFKSISVFGLTPVSQDVRLEEPEPHFLGRVSWDISPTLNYASALRASADVVIYDLRNGQIVMTVSGNDSAWHPTDPVLACCHRRHVNSRTSSCLKVLHVRQQNELFTQLRYSWHRKKFSPDGSWLVCMSQAEHDTNDVDVYIMDAVTGHVQMQCSLKKVRVIQGSFDLIFSADGSKAILDSSMQDEPHHVEVWDVVHQIVLHVQHFGTTYGLSSHAVLGFDPAGNVYAVASIEEEGFICFYNTISGDELAPLYLNEVTDAIAKLPPMPCSIDQLGDEDSDLDRELECRSCEGIWAETGSYIWLCMKLRAGAEADECMRSYIIRFA